MLKKNVLRSGLNRVYSWLFVLQSICMYASVATVAVTVIMRELFTVSIVWGYEIACWFVIILVFTSMPANLYRKSNIGVSFVFDMSPKYVKIVFSVIHYLVEVACLVMMAAGFKIWITKVGMGKMVASGFTNIQYYGVLGVGIFLSLIEMFCEIIDLFVVKEKVEEVRELTIEEELALEAEAAKNAEAAAANTGKDGNE